MTPAAQVRAFIPSFYETDLFEQLSERLYHLTNPEEKILNLHFKISLRLPQSRSVQGRFVIAIGSRALCNSLVLSANSVHCSIKTWSRAVSSLVEAGVTAIPSRGIWESRATADTRRWR